jgi:chemotaxis protein methyltransferase CheR
MTIAKKIMLEGRLSKRLRLLGMRTYSQYADFVQTPGGEDEIIHMIDAVSTNKTDFFREPHHYEVLQTICLPSLLEGSRQEPKISVWSAACSTGEEPYTLAIELSEFARKQHRLDFEILATDISTRVLQKAASAIYTSDRIDHVPMHIRKSYFLKSKDQKNPTVKIVPEIRNKVQFRRVNFMDNVLNVPTGMDIIFCRNVLIYFDRKTQEEVIKKLLLKLRTGGYLFIGHSESLHGMTLPLQLIKPTVYKKTE